jgi:hypothetical protein
MEKEIDVKGMLIDAEDSQLLAEKSKEVRACLFTRPSACVREEGRGDLIAKNHS